MEHDLIDAYIEALRRTLRWRTDIADVADEVADHLKENVARLVASGVAPDEAQRRTLACFGDLGLVARSFAQAPTGDLAAPTRATRTAGAAALGASLAWAAAVVAGAAGGHTELLTAWTLSRYEAWAALLAVAAGLTTLTAAGVLVRTGRLRRPTGVVAVVAGAVVTSTMGQLAWAVTVVMTLFGVAVLVAFRGDAGPADRFVRPMRVLGAAWPLGAAALLLGNDVFRIGPVDEYGDHPVAWLVPFLVCAAGSAMTLAVIGLRLRAERPAEFGTTPGTPAERVAAEGS